MQIIPVIDLLDGTVVHAKKGDRKNYHAIQSLISGSSKPFDIVAALLQYHPFKQLYIADLNAIQKTGNNNLEVIKNIAQHHPGLELWIDAGINHTPEFALWSGCNFNVILGSENFSDLDNFINIRKQLDSKFILSLDFMPDGYHGPQELLQNAGYWPEHVIVMSLPHVGANQGPDLGLIDKFRQHSQRHKLYAAGGVRSADDLNRLQQAGVDGALLATALHHKQISQAELEYLSL